MAKKSNEPDEPVERNELLEAIGLLFREARHKAKLTQKQVAEATGLTQAYIYLVESGGQNLTVMSLQRLADAVGVRIRDLMPEGPDAPPGAAMLDRLAEGFAAFAEQYRRHTERDAQIAEAVRGAQRAFERLGAVPARTESPLAAEDHKAEEAHPS